MFWLGGYLQRNRRVLGYGEPRSLKYDDMRVAQGRAAQLSDSLASAMYGLMAILVLSKQADRFLCLVFRLPWLHTALFPTALYGLLDPAKAQCWRSFGQKVFGIRSTAFAVFSRNSLSGLFSLSL
jgi:hypothetical protein